MNYGKPLYQLSLSERWLLVITDRGYKFYFDKDHLASHWELPNECVSEVQELKNKKEQVLLLLGVARGARIMDKEAGDLNELLHGVRHPAKQIEAVSSEEEDGQDEKIDNKDEVSPIQRRTSDNTGIMLGYESDTEDGTEMEDSQSSKEEQNPEKQMQLSEMKNQVFKSSEQESSDLSSDEDSSGGLNLSDLDDYEENSSEAAERFYNMLTRYEVDPYSSYDLECDKFMNDPIYFEIDDDEKRRSLFDQWCTQVARSNSNIDPTTRAVIEYCKLLLHNDVNLNNYLEFKRTFRQAPEFRGLESDKLRNKIFNKYIEFRKSDHIAFVLRALRKSGKLIVLARKLESKRPQNLLDALRESDFNINQEIMEFNFLDQQQQSVALEQFLANI
ncbi:hypothetical protein KL930_001572 [Ogataea haglerorum]|nr:hypothetical protein KL922_000998 [Ogataea haglerorum]KAG7782076.1 hypothetical protein KL930_001572 [Ogataea haglerorum]